MTRKKRNSPGNSSGIVDGASAVLIGSTQAGKDLGRIKHGAEVEDLRGCDMIIEAVFERIDVKDKVLARVEKFLTNNGVWSSNTSPFGNSNLHIGLIQYTFH